MMSSNCEIEWTFKIERFWTEIKGIFAEQANIKTIIDTTINIYSLP